MSATLNFKPTPEDALNNGMAELAEAVDKELNSTNQRELRDARLKLKAIKEDIAECDRVIAKAKNVRASREKQKASLLVRFRAESSRIAIYEAG